MRKRRTVDELIWDGLIKRTLANVQKTDIEQTVAALLDSKSPINELLQLNELTKSAVHKEIRHQKRQRLLAFTGKITACLVASLTIAILIIMNVKPWRSAALEAASPLLTKLGIYYWMTGTELPDAYIPTRIPERYPKSEIIVDNLNDLIIVFYNDSDDIYNSASYELIQTPTKVYVTTEGVLIKDVTSNGQQYQILHDTLYDIRTLYGMIPNTDKQFFINGKFTEEEILDIADSIEYRPRNWREELVP